MLVFDRFEGGYKPTIGVDVYSYDIERSSGAPEESVKFVIWDTDGNLGETILSHVYIKEAAAALVVGDVTRRSTLQRMVELGNMFMEAMPGRYCAFLINKSDLENAATELPQELVKSPIPMRVPSVTIVTDCGAGPRLNLVFYAFEEDDLILLVVSHAEIDTKLAVELSRQVRGRLMAEAEAAAKSRELARTNAELMIANSNLEQFAAIATHDLKAPMRALGYLATRSKVPLRQTMAIERGRS